MTEWDVFLIVAALIGFATSIAAPVIKLNTSITRLIDRLENLGIDLAELENSNRRSHERIHKKNDEQDEKLNDHETRIQILERKEN